MVGIIDKSGNLLVSYTYDAWGNVLSVTGSLASTLGRLNPLTYRGYVYDWETSLYYLQSRYYNPEWGRFINSDVFASTGQSFTGNNMFAYCGNNPVMRVDAGGNFWDLIGDIISLAFSVAEVIEDPTDVGAWVGLVCDAADVALPLVSGLGETARVVNAAVEVADVVDDVHDTKKAAEAVTSVAKVHGNSLSTTKETVGYILRKTDTDEIMKYGETTQGLKRYTKKFYRENGVYMDIVETGSKRDMHTWQHEKILEYYNTTGKLPPMNKSFW